MNRDEFDHAVRAAGSILGAGEVLVIKAIAGRPKDREFCRALLDAGYVNRQLLDDRLAEVADLDPAIHRSVEGMISA